MDEAQQSYLTRDCETDKEREVELARASLWPLTGQVISVGMFNPATSSGVTLYLGAPEKYEDAGVRYLGLPDEGLLLTQAWEAIAKYPRVVTFNGRCFDVPFLLLRSAILGVTPSRTDLLGNRYRVHPHCDLLDQLTFYGLTRKFPLDWYCHAFKIASPKNGITGADVGRLFAAGEIKRIARYCADDTRATALLYLAWLARLSEQR